MLMFDRVDDVEAAADKGSGNCQYFNYLSTSTTTTKSSTTTSSTPSYSKEGNGQQRYYHHYQQQEQEQQLHQLCIKSLSLNLINLPNSRIVGG